MFLRSFSIVFLSLLYTLIICIFLKPVFYTNSILLDFGFEQFEFNLKYPQVWFFLKTSYPIFSFFASLIVFNSLYTLIMPLFKSKKTSSIAPPDCLYLYLGKNLDGEKMYLPETRLISKHVNHWYYWYRKNKFCHVSFY